MNDRVKRQEEARGWHKEVTPEASAESLLETLRWWYEPAVAASRNPLIEAIKPTVQHRHDPGQSWCTSLCMASDEDSAPTFGDYAKDHPNPDAKEYEHDRRLRGQYE